MTFPLNLTLHQLWTKIKNEKPALLQQQVCGKDEDSMKYLIIYTNSNKPTKNSEIRKELMRQSSTDMYYFAHEYVLKETNLTKSELKFNICEVS